MSITYVGAAQAAASSLTLPSHQAGDLLLLHVGREGSATAPTPVNDWVLISSTSTTNIIVQLWAKVANSASEVSGTWTNASFMGCIALRSSSSLVVRPGQALATGSTVGSGGATAWNSILESPSTGDRWVILTIQHRSNDTDIETPPSGFTNRCGIAGGAAGEFAMHDSNGDSAATTATRNLTAGTSAAQRNIICEVIETQQPLSSGGGAVGRRNMRGGFIN